MDECELAKLLRGVRPIDSRPNRGEQALDIALSTTLRSGFGEAVERT